MHVRSLFVVVLAALLVGPATAHAQAKKSSAKAAAPAQTTTTSPNYQIGGWIGYEAGDLDGLQLRGDFVFPFQKLAPQFDLSFVGSVGYSYLTDSGNGVDITANILKFVPQARFTFAINPQWSIFGDAGLGLYWAGVSTDVNYGFGTASASDSSVGFMLRLGAGAFFQLNPTVKLGAQMVLDPMFGDYDDTTFSLLAGATFRI